MIEGSVGSEGVVEWVVVVECGGGGEGGGNEGGW